MTPDDIKKEQFAIFIGQAAARIEQHEPLRQAIKRVSCSHRTLNFIKRFADVHGCFSFDEQNQYFLRMTVQVDDTLELGVVNFHDRDGELHSFMTLPAVITKKVADET